MPPLDSDDTSLEPDELEPDPLESDPFEPDSLAPDPLDPDPLDPASSRQAAPSSSHAHHALHRVVIIASRRQADPVAFESLAARIDHGDARLPEPVARHPTALAPRSTTAIVRAARAVDGAVVRA